MILLDITIPCLNGIEAMRQLKGGLPSCRFVIVTQRTERQYVRAAFRAGASAFVVKQSAAADLLTAINEALRGRHYVPPSLAATMEGGFDPNQGPRELFGSALTPRQREVLQLVAEGK